MDDLADLKAHLVGEERPRSHRLCQGRVLLIHPSPRWTPHVRGPDGDGPGGMDGASGRAGLCCHRTVCVTAAGCPGVTGELTEGCEAGLRKGYDGKDMNPGEVPVQRHVCSPALSADFRSHQQLIHSTCE